MYKILIALLLVLFRSNFVNVSPLSTNALTGNGIHDNEISNFIVGEQQSSEDAMSSEYTSEIIEKIKYRILKNLNITEAPITHASPPILQTLIFEQDFEQNETWDGETTAIPEKTKTEFVYPVIENGSSFDENGNPCILFNFGFVQVQNKNFASAELWLFKKQNITNLSISVSKINYQQERLTAYTHNQSHSEGWKRFDISQILKNGNISSLYFEVSSEDGNAFLGVEGNEIPFILIHIDVSNERQISKRNAVDCTSENSTCCRVKYFVYFKDIGWDSWIIEPTGIEANFCRGRCSNDVSLPENNHGQILMALCDKKPQKAREMGKTDCLSCSPRKYDSIPIIYTGSNNDTFIHTMKDMIVARCGCI